jgi:hypothetical protein
MNLSSDGFTTPSELYASICLNQVMRSLLLSEMPTLDNIALAMQEVGDPSSCTRISGTDDANVRRSTDIILDSGKGKGKPALAGSASRLGT